MVYILTAFTALMQGKCASGIWHGATHSFKKKDTTWKNNHISMNKGLIIKQLNELGITTKGSYHFLPRGGGVCLLGQSTRNPFELRRTLNFCPADHHSFAGHFEFSNPFAGLLSKFAGQVRQVRRLSRTLSWSQFF